VTAGRLHKAGGGWRSSQIVGATVYNDADQRIGTVDDLIVGQDGKINTAVLSVGGFLGIGSKLVRVPYDQLRFEELRPGGIELAPPVAGTGAPTTAPGSTARDVPAGTPAPRAATPPNVTITRIVLPGASKESVTAMPKFDYGT
jgi:sporulation protein YlmC with PRC-barrel domain